MKTPTSIGGEEEGRKSGIRKEGSPKIAPNFLRVFFIGQ